MAQLSAILASPLNSVLQLPKYSIAQSVCICAAYGFQRHREQNYREGENSLCRSHLRLRIYIRMWIQLLLLKFGATVIFSKRSNSPSKSTSTILRKKCWNSTISKNVHELLPRDLYSATAPLFLYAAAIKNRICRILHKAVLTRGC